MHPADTTLPLYKAFYLNSTYSPPLATLSKERCNLFIQALIAYINQLWGGHQAEMSADLLKRNPDLAAELVHQVLKLHDPALVLPAYVPKMTCQRDRDTWGYVTNIIKALKRSNLVLSVPQSSAAIAIKLSPEDLGTIPSGRLPWSEIFVFHQHIEGTLMRGNSIARGGVRWSDRLNYRQELYQLWKTQVLKNAIVVPCGGKGAFKIRDNHDPREAYRMFISALLDVIDMTPSQDPAGDSYLVVAPDKGTAHFLDEANALAHQRGYWLDDAFASGSSSGYDHKKMGITARGAWVSLRHHQEALSLPNPLSCVGVGDMSGDVFGNGILIEPTLQLKGAFNHRHIFLEPFPTDGLRGELQRLFTAEQDWGHFNHGHLSSQGGIFSRQADSILLSPGMQQFLETTEKQFSPDGIIQLLLKAKVDLLFFGGIGTYVKGSSETHDITEDPSNDAVRIDACDLRAKIIGEGANVAMTQAARIQFAQANGRVNTDALDNSGGVDCSDHEVNLKILFMRPHRDGRLTSSQRNQLIASLESDVQKAVLRHNKSQNEILSRISPFENYDEHIAFLNAFLKGSERDPWQSHFNPKDHPKVLSRPELCIVLAHSKNHLSQSFFESSAFRGQEKSLFLSRYFPPSLQASFHDDMMHHPLARHIAISEATNLVIDTFGPTLIKTLSQHFQRPYADCALQGLALLSVLRLWQDPWHHLPLRDRITYWRMLLEVFRNPHLWISEGDSRYNTSLQIYSRDYAMLIEAYRQIDTHDSPALSSSQGFLRLWYMCQGLAFIKAYRHTHHRDISLHEVITWLKHQHPLHSKVAQVHKVLHGLSCHSHHDVPLKRSVLSYFGVILVGDARFYGALETVLAFHENWMNKPSEHILAWSRLAKMLEVTAS